MKITWEFDQGETTYFNPLTIANAIQDSILNGCCFKPYPSEIRKEFLIETALHLILFANTIKENDL